MRSRRDMLAATMAAAVTLPIAAKGAASNRDADLVAVCARFDTLAVQRRGCFEGTGSIQDDDAAERAARPILASMRRLVDEMGVLRATSSEGIQARAHSLAVYGGHGGWDFTDRSSMVGKLQAFLMRDATALGDFRAVVVVPPSPDTALLAACKAFDALERSYADTFQNLVHDDPAEIAAEAERDRLQEAQQPYAEVIATTPARTPEGLRAKARSLVGWQPEIMNGRYGDIGTAMMGSVLRDLIRTAA